jgi:hypothetical protein
MNLAQPVGVFLKLYLLHQPARSDGLTVKKGYEITIKNQQPSQ